MRTTVAIAASLGLLACIGCADDNEDLCASDDVVSRAAPGVEFSAFQTFAVLDEADYPEELPGDLPAGTRGHLASANAAAAAELTALGLMQVDDAMETPDLYVFSMAATETMVGVSWDCVPGYVWWGWYWYWDPCAWMAEVEFAYTLGSVVVGVADEASQVAVFGGAVQGVLECGDADIRLEQGVQQIFADYPG